MDCDRSGNADAQRFPGDVFLERDGRTERRARGEESGRGNGALIDHWNLPTPLMTTELIRRCACRARAPAASALVGLRGVRPVRYGRVSRAALSTANAWRASDRVRGHEKVPAGGQV